MPTGHVQRIDQERETVYLVRGSKTYAAPLAEVESRARVPSARVLFDVVREHGIESAADVRLRSGTRTSRRQRRFGDLTGAKGPGAKVQTAASRSLGVDVTTQPFRVANAWLDALRTRDYAGAASLYLPEATIHTEAGAEQSHRRIRAILEQLPTPEDTERDGDDDGPGADGSVEIEGIDNYIRIGWRVGGPGQKNDRKTDHETDHAAYLIVEHGAIAEQWIDIEPDGSAEELDDEPSVLIVRHGNVPDRVATYATERIDRLVDHSGRPLRFAKVKLTMAENPGFDRPAMAEASLEFDHLKVRAGADGASFTETIDLMVSRLGARIEHQHDRQRHRPNRLEPVPGGWRHGNLARRQTPFFDRPPEDREVVRHKSFAPGAMTPDEATLDMALLDYDFFLFVEIDTGEDALLVRDDEGTLVLHRTTGSGPSLDASVNQIEPAGSTTPKLSVSEAIELLDASGDRHQFFVNRSTGRGNVIYRRLDGHYGIITPSDDEA